MAQRGNQADEQKFCCSICLDLLKDPVTIPCGHNYCMSCITKQWNEEDQKFCHSCPQCRQEFRPRPAAVKNTLLAELVEDFKKTGLRAAPADHCYAGPGDLACDFCTGRKLKAFKSCLVCMVSYCQTHLQPHYESAAFKTHKLVEPSAKLQHTICSRHDEVMKIFCRTDQKCICILCSMDEHEGHKMVSAATARAEKQQELDKHQKNLQQRIQDRDKDLKLLQQEVEAINRSADKAVEDGEEIFTQLIRLMEQRRSEVKQEIRSQQETEVSRVEELQEKLQQEMAELKRSHAELKKLSDTEDHTVFLHNYPSVSTLTEPKDSPRPKVDRLRFFEDVMAAVRAAREKIQEILTEPITRADFYSCQITLDPNTAHSFLVLSEGNTKITRNENNKPYPHHPDRFIHIVQVLSKDGLTGRCYWEVQKSSSVGVAVAYRSIDRSGDWNARAFGYNKKSWMLYCSSGYAFSHDNCSTNISGPESSRVGVYLDHSAGTLSFYSVSETMTLLHRVQTTFTEPLHAGIYLGGSDGNTAEFCKLK